MNDDLITSHQPRQRSGAAGKLVGLDSHFLKHTDKDVAERRVDLVIEGKVLSMLEAATREDDWEVGVVVDGPTTGRRAGSAEMVADRR